MLSLLEVLDCALWIAKRKSKDFLHPTRELMIKIVYPCQDESSPKVDEIAALQSSLAVFYESQAHAGFTEESKSPEGVCDTTYP